MIKQAQGFIHTRQALYHGVLLLLFFFFFGVWYVCVCMHVRVRVRAHVCTRYMMLVEIRGQLWVLVFHLV